MNESPMIIEFVGLPGVGKTTLSHKIADNMRDDFKMVSEPSFIAAHHRNRFSQALRVYLLALKSLILHPGFSFRSIKAILNSEQRSFTESKNMSVNWLYNSAMTRHLSITSGMHILDQGLIQAVWSTAVQAKTQTWFNLMDLLKVNYNCRLLIVWVSANVPTVLSRLKDRERKQSRFERMSDDEIQFAMAIGSNILTTIKREFDERAMQDPRFFQVQIDNDDDGVTEQIKKVVDVINEISDTPEART